MFFPYPFRLYFDHHTLLGLPVDGAKNDPLSTPKPHLVLPVLWANDRVDIREIER